MPPNGSPYTQRKGIPGEGNQAGFLINKVNKKQVMDIIKEALTEAKKEAIEVVEKCDKRISNYQNDARVLKDKMTEIAAKIGKVLEAEKLELNEKIEAMATLRVIEKLETQF